MTEALADPGAGLRGRRGGGRSAPAGAVGTAGPGRRGRPGVVRPRCPRVPPRAGGRAPRLPAAAALRRRAAHLAGRRAGQPAGHRHPRGRSGGLHDASGSGLVAWWVVPGVEHRGGLRPRRGGLAAGRRGRDDDRPAGRHAEAHRVDPRGREPAQRRDGAGGPAHLDHRDHGVGDRARGVVGVRRRRGRRDRWPAWPWRPPSPRPASRVQDPVLDTTLSLVAPFIAYLAAEASTAAGCCRWSSSAWSSGTSHPRCSPRRRASPSRPTGAPSPSSSRTRCSCSSACRCRRSYVDATEGDLSPTRLAVICGVVLLATLADPHRLGVRGDGGLPVRPGQDARGGVELEPRHPGVVGGHARRRDAGRRLRAARGDTAPRRAGAGRLRGRGRHPARQRHHAALAGAPAGRRSARTRPRTRSRRRHCCPRRPGPGWTGSRSSSRRATTRTVIERLEERARSRADAAWERLGAPSDNGDAQRDLPAAAAGDAATRSAGSSCTRATCGKVDDEVLQDVMNLLDTEESLLDRLEDKGTDVERELVAKVERVRALRAPRPRRRCR